MVRQIFEVIRVIPVSWEHTLTDSRRTVWQRRFFVALLWIGWHSAALAEERPVTSAVLDRPVPVSSVLTRFDLDRLSKVPDVFPAENLQVEGVKSFFYRGFDYKGRPTRVFAYYGVPTNNNLKAGEKHPAMVLIHGGGGTAFDRWVKVWNSRGYAAIAMDLCGCIPVGTYGKWERHEHGGPPGWDASFGQLDDAIEDQWTFQATSAALFAFADPFVPRSGCRPDRRDRDLVGRVSDMRAGRS